MDAKRKKAQKLILDTMSLLDVTGLNTKKYIEIFKNMSDSEFVKWVKNNDEHLYMEVLPFKNEPSMHDIERAAKFIDVPLMEKVYVRNDGGDPDDPSITTFTQPVGYLHIKKLQQVLSKKTSTTVTESKVNKYGSAEANSKITEPEIYAMTSYQETGAILKELLGVRADNAAKDEFFRSLSLNGHAYLDDVVDRIEGHGTLAIVNYYLLGMGINNNLMAPGLLINANQMDIIKKQEMKEKKNL